MAQKRQHSGGGDDAHVRGAEKRNRVADGPQQGSLSKTIEEARRRAQDAFRRSGLQGAAPPPQASSSGAASHGPASTGPPSASSEKPTGIHPLLLGDAARIQERFRSLAPKFASLQANSRTQPVHHGRRPPAPAGAAPQGSLSKGAAGRQAGDVGADESGAEEKKNPYLGDANDEAPGAPAPKRKSMRRGFQFHRQGRYIMEAEQLRRDQQLNELKLRIQQSARKVGMQDELLGDERILRREMPPDVEWWDMAFLPHQTYEDVPDPRAPQRAYPRLEGRETPIDHLVQHPIPIPAPTDKIRVQPHGVILTKQEMKKMRKQRRAAEQQDKRDRVKMGLLPPDPPKVKLSNLMRVLSSEAVADPTKVEARVRREVAARREQHERTNAERMLTDEERHQRRKYKTSVEEAKGVWCQVYRIRQLVSPSHKFKVRKNAQQHHLGGIVITHPDQALVVVEGSAKALKAYKRLMLARIDWADPGRPRDADDDDDAAAGAADAPDDASVDLTENTCDLVFEGPVRDRNLTPGVVRTEACPTDALAKEQLGAKLASFWDAAKRAGVVREG
ncbi:U4/U5/U6 small nuclear ribonucleoprotein prp3 [Malassezia sp. CBS 17886]|nr:U4/U5/U6 small nuclear ribonucleoprotein prp3 [Malassezia sp. CBS 17886]